LRFLPEDGNGDHFPQSSQAPDGDRLFVGGFLRPLAHPQSARRLVEDTRLATKGETELIRTIAADFGPCLPEGNEVTIRPTSVRMAIAEALYRAVSGLPAPTIQEAS